MNITGETILTTTSILTTIVSVIVAFREAKKVKYLRKKKHRLIWDDIEIGINQLFKKIEEDYKPEIVICLSERGTAIVTIGFSLFGRNLPIFTGFWQDPSRPQIDMANTGFIELVSRNRKFYLPEGILNLKDRRLLIIDDWAFTGQAMSSIYNALKSSGISDENIRCANLVTTPSAKASAKPHPSKYYYYYEFPDNDFYFPWGKAT